MKNIHAVKYTNRRNPAYLGKRKMRTIFKIPMFTYSLLSLGLALLVSINLFSISSAQGVTDFIRMVRTIETNELDIHNPVGLAYSPQANIFYVLEAHSTNQSAIITMSPFEDLIDSSTIDTLLIDPINMTFNNLEGSLLLLDIGADELIEVLASADGNLDTQPGAINRYPINLLGLQDPQGMTIDPLDGSLYILDTAANEIVRIEPDSQGGFSNLSSSPVGRISRMDLSQTGLVAPRGLAMNPADGHLYLYSPTEYVVHEITWSGQLVGTYDISTFEIKDPQSLVFAKSGDMTDDPDIWNLHVADSGTNYLDSRSRIMSLSSQPAVASPTTAEYQVYLPMTVRTPVKKYNPQLELGRVVELTFSPPAIQTLATNFTSTLVNTIDASNYNPPSPDSSGLAYVPVSDSLVMVDGEVEETVSGITHFAGANVWETTLGGSVVYTTNISKVSPTDVPMTNEPTGVAYNPSNGHFYVSDDNGKEIYDLNPGPDLQYGTSDDTWTSFDTQTHGSSDPEGIAFDSINNRLFVTDGVNAEIYEYTLSGTLLNHFDVLTYGIEDPEGVEFNPLAGTLFILSSRRTVALAAETTRTGSLIQTIDVSDAGARTPAGLAYAPASDGSGAMRFYIVDRGIDNNSQPNLIDGAMYEITAPGSQNVAPIANDDDETTAVNTPVGIDVAFNDSDANGNLDPTTTNTTCTGCSGTSSGILANHSDGTFTYTPNTSFIGNDNFVYEICDTDNLCDTATVNINVTPANDPPIANDDPNESTDEDTPGTFNVAANDNDPDTNLDPTSTNNTCATCTNPANGTLQNYGDGTFGYSPDQDFNGQDGFVYEICDTYNVCDTATVTITVNPLPDPPAATDDDVSTVGTAPILIDVALNDSDPDGDLDPATTNTGCAGCSIPGSGNINNNGNGTFTYTANQGFIGIDSFVYQICDSGSPSLCATATANINVSEVLLIDTIYVSSNSPGTVGGVSFRDEDILALDFGTGTWSMYFDGSDVGLDVTANEIDGFHINPDGSILISIDLSANLPDVGSVDDIDIVRFIPTSLGDNTSGSYEMYFDGSDVDLTADSGEDIDAFSFAPDGDLVISTRGTHNIGGMTGPDVNLLKFTATSLGDVTSGSWSLYFDGLDVGVGDGGNNEDINAVWIDSNNDIYLSSRIDFSVSGAAGDSSDIYICEPSSLGETTSCTFNLFWDGSANGFTGENLNGLSIVTSGGQSPDTDPPTLVNNTGSTVLEGGSDPIPNTELQYDDAQPAGSISYSVTSSPTNGQVELTSNPGSPVSSFTQSDIDSGLLVYIHNGTNTTSDSFGFSVSDGLGNVLSGQSFAITVTPVDNEVPVVINNTGSTVLEGGTDPIPNNELQYDDTQPASSISYSVTSAPANGQLELTTAPGSPILSFTQADIDSGLLVYTHNGSNTTSDTFGFNVGDGLGNVLTGQSFALSVTPVDDDPPTLGVNTGSTVIEGATDPIPNTELRFDDAQPAGNISYSVTAAPTNGQLELTTSPGNPINVFTQADIDSGLLVYVHDGSNTTSDSFGFSVNDGLGNVLAGQSFAITIIAQDNDPPSLVNNTGSTLLEGGSDPISNTELQFSDAQPTSSVSYSVTSSPTNGQLELTTGPGNPISVFTQADINSGLLVYVHDSSNTTSDNFGFDVGDGLGNVTAGQSFALTITPVDDELPILVNNTGSTVLEGGTDPIPNTELRYDDAQPPSSVSYSVTSGPTNGQLELTSGPGNPISTFTQADIDSGLLVYVHNDSNTTSDSFGFDVSDGQGNSLSGESFAITITPVDDDPPTFVNNTGSTAQEGGTDPIPNTELRYDDAQPPSSVNYSVTSGPANGQLELTSASGSPIFSFTQADIDGGLLVYVHNGSNTTSDSFGFSVDDGLSNILASQSFAITVTPVDNEAPTLVNNTGSTVLTGGTDPIPSTELQYADVQPATSISYTVTSGPTNGQLELTSSSGTPVATFTQADIDNDLLVYVHNGSGTTSDSFGFNVDDGLGNVTAGQSFATTIITQLPITSLYVSSTSNGTVGSVSFKDEDILALEIGTGTWSMFLDGSLVGLGASGVDIDAFHIDQDGSILLSFTSPLTIQDVGSVDDSDIVRFIPIATDDYTSGTYEWFFDGSDVDLLDNSEDIDAIGFAPDNRLVISTSGSYNVTGISGKDEDLVVFNDTTFGETTSGTWELYFDGSDVGLDTNSNEDISGAWIESSGDVYLSTRGAFSVTGATGDSADIFLCEPSSIGDVTACTFSSFWDGSLAGFGSEVISGISLNGSSGGSGNSIPQVIVSSPPDGSAFISGSNITFTGSADDAEDGDLTASLSWVSSLDGTIGSGASFSRADLSPGIHNITASVADSGGTLGSKQITISITSNPPSLPVLVAPADASTGVSNSPNLEVAVSDPDGDNLTVTFYGRPAGPSSNSDFTIIAMPDTQHYTDDPANYANFSAQTQWIVDNRVPLNIQFVTHLGDVVENGNNFGDDTEWQVADGAMSLLEDPLTTTLTDGIPFGVAPGNHDLGDTGNGATGESALFNQFFGVTRFQGRGYYGGSHNPALNDNNYELFSAGGYEFIIFHFEYDDAPPNSAVLNWADNLLKIHSNRRGIVTTHYLMNGGSPPPFSVQGQAIYDALKDNPNLFLMLGGHISNEAHRTDVFNGGTVHSVLSDYQNRINGGDGWLRIMEFSPVNNEIRVKTYSPTLDQYETDANSQFTLPYDMQGSDFQIIGTNSNVPSGSTTSMTWSGLDYLTEYEWYATVTDGDSVVNSATWSFTTDVEIDTQPPVITILGDNPAYIDLGTTYNDAGATAFDNVDGDLTSTIITTSNVDSNTEGTYSVSYEVTDSSNNTANDARTVIVTPANDPPLPVNDNDTTDEDNAVIVNVAGNDNDPNGNLDPNSANSDCAYGSSGCDGATNGTLTDNGDGTITYDPNPNHNGGDSFVYEICDTFNACATATVNITINPMPDPPLAVNDSDTTTEGTAVIIDVANNDSDPDGNLNPNSANSTCANGSTGCNDAASGTLTDNANGTITYTPNPGFTGNDSFIYEICDTTPLCSTATVDVTVDSLNPISVLYTSSTSGGTAGSVAFKDEDILAFDIGSQTWSMYFDGSDVGLNASGQEINGLHINSDGSILLSLGTTVTLPGVGAVDDFDIVRFIPAALGDTTAGTYEMYFDGEDVGLSGEDIDAFSIAADGRIIISLRGSFNLGIISGEDEDQLAFTATSLGATTSGTWEMYFDGSDVGLDTASSEDVNAIWLDDNGDIYMSTRGVHSVPGVSGESPDILTCIPGSLGDNTSCTFSQYWDGSLYGFGTEDMNGLFIG